MSLFKRYTRLSRGNSSPRVGSHGTKAIKFIVDSHQFKRRNMVQWRIQDFPDSGGVGNQAQRWGRQPIVWTKFPQHYMKMKEIGPRGGDVSLPPSPRSANVYAVLNTIAQWERALRADSQLHKRMIVMRWSNRWMWVNLFKWLPLLNLPCFPKMIG